jgi:DNA mismatch endonuclease, patch repair protein
MRRKEALTPKVPVTVRAPKLSFLSVSSNARVRMQANRSRNTGPEIALRRALWQAGLRGYRLHRNLVGHPDIVFSRSRVAIFVHGCFWHSCPKCCKPEPKNNAYAWKAKFRATVQRDRANVELLHSAGWETIVVWECEIRKNLPRAVSGICRLTRSQEAKQL